MNRMSCGIHCKPVSSGYSPPPGRYWIPYQNDAIFFNSLLFPDLSRRNGVFSRTNFAASPARPTYRHPKFDPDHRPQPSLIEPPVANHKKARRAVGWAVRKPSHGSRGRLYAKWSRCCPNVLQSTSHLPPSTTGCHSPMRRATGQDAIRPSRFAKFEARLRCFPNLTQGARILRIRECDAANAINSKSFAPSCR